MITAKEVKLKAERYWKEVLQSYISGIPVFPKDIPQIGLVSQDELVKNFLSISKQFDKLQAESKECKGYGYSLEWEEKNFRTIGKNRLIRRIYIESLDDYLKLTGKEKEYNLFNNSVKKILEPFPELKDWIFSYPLKVIGNAVQWNDILKVCHWFKEAHVPDRYYIRELPIQVHTKFIEEHKPLLFDLLNILLPSQLINQEYNSIKDFEKRFGLKYNKSLIRVRILDDTISRSYFSGLSDISITESEFNQLNLPCKRIFILENKTNFSNLMNFLTLPVMKDSIGLFGSGFKVGLLKQASWLHEKELFYWGDLDVQGFQILSQLRSYFPNVKSFLMDKATLQTFISEAASGVETNVNDPAFLTDDEMEVYRLLKVENLRLEQEKVVQGYVVEAIGKLFSD